MEESSSTNQAPLREPNHHRRTIVLHVLSPSVEVPNKITFPALPIAMTINELKHEICDRVASRPRPERQRLIYRGKALVQESLTLREVFTQENIDNSESLSLHLVLPPNAGPYTSASASSAHPVHTHPINALHSLPSRTGSPALPQGAQQGAEHNPATTQAGSASQLVPTQQQTGHVHSQPGQLPPHLQQVINNQVQMLIQQQVHAAQGALAGQGLPAAVPQMPVMPVQAPQTQQPSFPQIIAQQQQARAAAGLHGLGGGIVNQMQGNPAPHLHSGMPGQAPNPQSPASAPGTTTRVVRENQGPNGEWRVVVESTSIISNNNNNQVATSQRPSFNQNNSVPPVYSNERPQTPQAVGPSGVFLTNQPPVNGGPIPDTFPLFQQHLSGLESALSSGTAPAESIFQQSQARLSQMANQPDVLPPGAEAALRARLNNLSTQADQLRASLTSLLMRVVAEQSQPMLQPALQQIPQPAPQAASSSTVYVLSSPSGPQALLVSPSGLYSAPWPQPITTHGLFQLAIPHGLFHPIITPSEPQNHPQPIPTQTTQPNLQQPPPNNPDPTQPQENPQNQNPPDPQNNPQNLVRILLPLGGHLWLLIRLFGFVYFFTAGGSLRRALLLGLCALLVFLAQTGIFRPLAQQFWNPVRRHAQNLLPLGVGGGNEELERVLRMREGGARVPAEHEATLEAARRRLLELEQRNRGDNGQIRGLLRRAERAMALFVASLVPGVGERHVAARGAAEVLARHERELREEGERERERREMEEQGEGQGEGQIRDGNRGAAAEEGMSTGVSAGAGELRERGGEGQGQGQGQGQGHVDQRPVVEI